MKILEQKGVEITNIDGAAFNNFCAGGRNGILKGVLNECVFFQPSSNIIAINTGEIIVQGFRVVVTESKSFSLTSTPASTTRYQLVLSITKNGEEVYANLFVREIKTLQQDKLFESDYGIHEVEILRFTHQTNGNIEDITRTLDIINGGTSANSSSDFSVGIVTTTTLEAGLDAEVDVEQVERNGKVVTDFNFSIPKGRDSEVTLEQLNTKADKYIFFDTENPVDIQSGMDLSGQTIAISSYYDMDGMLIQFENGKYIGAVMGTFGLFPSPSEYTAEVVFWERGSWYKEQYTFPTGQGWTVTSVDSFAYHYINIIEHKVVDCEYNYKKIESSLKPLFRYGFTAYITLGNGMPVECYGSALSSDPNLIYDENAATYSFVDAFNIGLLMSGMVLTNYTYNNSYLPMILTGSAGEFRLFWGTAMGQLMLYDYDINSSSSYIRIDTRTTVL